jgi:hypothetical protein
MLVFAVSKTWRVLALATAVQVRSSVLPSRGPCPSWQPTTLLCQPVSAGVL